MNIHNDRRENGAFEWLMQGLDIVRDRAIMSDQFLNNLNVTMINGYPRKMLDSQGGLRTIETAIHANMHRLDLRAKDILLVVGATILSGSYLTHTVHSDFGDDVYTLFDDGSLSVTISQPELTVFTVEPLRLLDSANVMNADYLKRRLIAAAQRK